MTSLESFNRWHQTKVGLAVFGALELLLAFAFVLWAIDSGNLLDWFFAIFLTLGGLQNLIKLALKGMAYGQKD